MKIGFLLACLLVRYLKITAGKDVALLYDAANGKIVCWAREQQTHSNHVGTASVTLQRGAGVRSKGCLILTSKCPEVICLGMAALTGVKKIIHFDGKTSKTYDPGNKLAPGSDYPSPKEPDYPDKILPWMDNCLKLLSDAKDQEFKVEFANVPAGSPMAALIQNVISDGEVEPDEAVPQRPPGAVGPLSHGRDPAMDSFWMSVARRLVGAIHTGGNLVHESMRRGHNIGCVLVGENNNILAWGVNTLNNNPTYHAETKCIWMFQHHNQRQKVPANATLYTTLQSCLMCAATIKHACGDNKVRVVYADRDKVDGSVLTQKGGAEEIAISKILTGDDYRPLLAQHLLLARARWDRIKRAVESKLAQRAGTLPLRSGVEASLVDLRAKKTADLREAITKATNLLRPVRNPELIFATTDAMSKGFKEVEARGRLDDALKHKERVEKELENINSAMKGANEATIAAVSKLFRDTAMRAKEGGREEPSLEEQRSQVLAVETEANRLAFSGGAPVLLKNPVVFKKLYQTPEIVRPKEPEPRTKILDLNTEIQALDLLIQSLQAAETYGGH
jgi:tRNA(Arg) A34 adenosine deaminase TadA